MQLADSYLIYIDDVQSGHMPGGWWGALEGEHKISHVHFHFQAASLPRFKQSIQYDMIKYPNVLT